jgi:hypothetical protein
MNTTGLPFPVFGEPAEDFAQPTNELQCEDSPIARQGVVEFKDFVINALGGLPGGIVRPCLGGAPLVNPVTKQGKPSGHYTGRAWDWMVSASKEEDAAKVQKLIDWLSANDFEMFRRIGLTYIIWNKESWSVIEKNWHPYTGSSPHTDHVHFSFGADGADGNTSFFRWLVGGRPELPESLRPKTGTSYGWFVGGLLIGTAVPMIADYAYRKLKQIPRKAGRRA